MPPVSEDGSGRSIVWLVFAEHGGEVFRDGRNPILCRGSNHAGEGSVGLCSPVVLGVLPAGPSNHHKPQRPFGTIVGRLHVGLLQEAQQVATVMMQADPIEQPLIVVVLENTIPQVMGHLAFQPLHLLLVPVIRCLAFGAREK